MNRLLVRPLTASTLLAASLILAACSTAADTAAPASSTVIATNPSAETTAPADATKDAPSPAAFLSVMNDAGAEAFYCETPDVLVAQLGSGSSYFRSKTDTGFGLEILTLEFVSYARFSGPLPSDASPARQAILAKIGSVWATAGIPDTITLEELPATPSQCLSWIGIEEGNITDVSIRTDGSMSYSVVAGENGAPAGSGQITVTPSGKPQGFSFLTTDTNLGMFISFGSVPSDVLPEYGKASDGKLVPGGVTLISMDEYNTLVGG